MSDFYLDRALVDRYQHQWDNKSFAEKCSIINDLIVDKCEAYHVNCPNVQINQSGPPGYLGWYDQPNNTIHIYNAEMEDGGVQLDYIDVTIDSAYHEVIHHIDHMQLFDGTPISMPWLVNNLGEDHPDIYAAARQMTWELFSNPPEIEMYLGGEWDQSTQSNACLPPSDLDEIHPVCDPLPDEPDDEDEDEDEDDEDDEGF